MNKSDKLTLSALLIVFALPPLAAYSTYFFGLLPTGGSNKGYLVEPLIELPTTPPAISQNHYPIFNGRWNMVMLIPHICDRECQKNIYLMRQVQVALGKDASNLRRVLFLQNHELSSEFKEFLKDYPKVQIYRLETSMSNSFKQAVEDIYQRIFIVDPWGNLMMYHPQAFDPKDLLSDLKRLIMVNSNNNRE